MGKPYINKTEQGAAAELQAIAWLQNKGLVLLQRNFRTPGRGGGEIDAIMRDSDGTLVFVEVRQRANRLHGGAAASISKAKQRRIVYAAQHYLRQYRHWSASRFDVMVCDAGQWQWLPAAFDASGY